MVVHSHLRAPPRRLGCAAAATSTCSKPVIDRDAYAGTACTFVVAEITAAPDEAVRQSVSLYNMFRAAKSLARRSMVVPAEAVLVPRTAIRRFARAIVEKFQPDTIILFGSYAYGSPNADSDVDMLVVMSTRDTFNQAVNIRMAIDYDFSLDLLVRTPRELAQRLKLGDPFMGEIVSKGKVLYELVDVRMGAKSRSRHDRGTKTPTVRTLRS